MRKIILACLLLVMLVLSVSVGWAQGRAIVRPHDVQLRVIPFRYANSATIAFLFGGTVIQDVPMVGGYGGGYGSTSGNSGYGGGTQYGSNQNGNRRSR